MNLIETVPQGGSGIEKNGLAGGTSFSSTRSERISSVLSYFLAYIYTGIYYYTGTRSSVCIALTAILMITITELIHREVPRSGESWIWLFCFCLTVLSAVLERESVWNRGEVILFIHIFAVWWIISRAGVLLDGRSGHLLPLDALNGFMIIPFGHFFLRVRTLFDGISGLFRNRPARKRRGWGWTVVALAVSAMLFFKAADLLLSADSGFQARFTGISEYLRRALSSISNLFDETVPERIIFSLLVGCWLFGLISGSFRHSRSVLEAERGYMADILQKLRRVPSRIWALVIGLFSVMYLAFFILQSSYLFGAFTGTLPEGFIVSQYAREGFFELCKVISVNFTLLWFVTRMTSDATRSSHLFLVPCLMLLAESMLFAVIAFSKLLLYISCFGFTPLRLQSTWLVCLCFAGCALWMYSLLTGKPAFRKWMVYGAVTLSVLCLV